MKERNKISINQWLWRDDITINISKLLLVTIFLCLLFPSQSYAADTLGGLVTKFLNAGYLTGVAKLIINGVCYLAGIFFGIKSLTAFKDMSDGDRQTKLKTPIIFFLAAGIFMAIPTMFTVGASALGYNASGSSLDGSVVMSNGTASNN